MKQVLMRKQVADVGRDDGGTARTAGALAQQKMRRLKLR
jgi:hypothetical protein